MVKKIQQLRKSAEQSLKLYIWTKIKGRYFTWMSYEISRV